MNQSTEITNTFEALKVYLTQNHNAKIAAGGKEITKKCHICGDSRDPSSRHMYIGMKNGRIVYNCFKCNSSGIVGREFLRAIGCEDIDLIKLCVQTNNSDEDITAIIKNRNHKFRNPIIEFHNTPGNNKKLESINRRMGYNFKHELGKFKIILNLSEFLHDNGIHNYTRYPDIMYQLSNFYVGFLSSDNLYINLRRLVPEEKVHPSIRSRYVKYNIFDQGRSDYYIIPSSVFPMEPMICIAEGPFDIIGAYLLNRPIRNYIYAAIGGKSYMGLMNYLIDQYGLINFSLHIYADNDINKYEIKQVSDFLKPYRNPVYLHYNLYDGQKDYGVDRKLIKDSIIQI